MSIRNQTPEMNSNKTTSDTVGTVSTSNPTEQQCTNPNPSRICIGQTGEGGGVMTDEHRNRVKDLAFLKWQLHANESARASGLITAPMFVFARDALHKDIADLEALCYNDGYKGGGNSGFEICAATA